MRVRAAMHLVDQAFCRCCAGESEHELGCPRSPTFGRAPVVALADWGPVGATSNVRRRIRRMAREYRSGVRLRLVQPSA